MRDFNVVIKPEFKETFAKLGVDTDKELAVLVCSANDTYIVWQCWEPSRRCYVVHRSEVDVV